MTQTPDNPSRDRETLRLLVAGDAIGLDRLLNDHGPHVQAHLRRKLGHLLDAWQIEDAMSLAAIRAWQSASRFDAELGRLRAWFAVIARNSALHVLAQRHDDLFVPLDDLEPGVIGIHAEPEIDRARLIVDVQRMIDKLPPLQRLVLHADLSAGEPLPGSELARRFGSSQSSIYVARMRGRRELRERLERLGYDHSGRHDGRAQHDPGRSEADRRGWGSGRAAP